MSQSKYTKAEKYFARKKITHNKSFWQKLWAGKRMVLVVVLIFVLVGTYINLRLAHIKIIDKVTYNVQKTIFDYIGVNLEYKNIEYYGWKFWNLRAEIRSPQIAINQASFSFYGTTDKIIIVSNALSNDLNIILPNDIKIVVNKLGKQDLESVLTWDKDQQNVIKLKLIDLIKRRGDSQLISEVDYSISGLNLIIDDLRYIGIDNIKFNMRLDSKDAAKELNEIHVRLNNFVLNKENRFFKACYNIFKDKTQGGDFVFDVNCALNIESQEENRKTTDGTNDSTLNGDGKNINTANVTNARLNKLDNGEEIESKSINTNNASSGVGYDIFSHTIDSFKAKQCVIKSNIFELGFDGEVRAKEDILQYIDLKNEIANYEQLVDCYFEIMRDSIKEIKSTTVLSAPSPEISKFEKMWDDEKLTQTKQFLKNTLPNNGSSVHLHLILQNPKDRIEIKNGGYFDELLVRFLPDLNVK